MSKTLALAPVTDASADAQMGQQLTTQYHRAVGGMKEVMIFGAMMMQLREEHPEMAKKGNPKLQMPKRGHLDQPQPLSLQKWLETYAPEVKRQTAQRFLAVTESIAESYTQIVGPAVAKQYSLAALVTSPADQLPEKAAAKQLELFEFVNGTSQRSWLDQFLPDSPQKRAKRKASEEPRPPTQEELAQMAEEEITMIINSLDAWFLALHHTRITSTTRSTTGALLEEALKKIRAVK